MSKDQTGAIKTTPINPEFTDTVREFLGDKDIDIDTASCQPGASADNTVTSGETQSSFMKNRRNEGLHREY